MDSPELKKIVTENYGVAQHAVALLLQAGPANHLEGAYLLSALTLIQKAEESRDKSASSGVQV